jgi:hypothetical protein
VSILNADSPAASPALPARYLYNNMLILVQWKLMTIYAKPAVLMLKIKSKSILLFPGTV